MEFILVGAVMFVAGTIIGFRIGEIRSAYRKEKECTGYGKP